MSPLLLKIDQPGGPRRPLRVGYVPLTDAAPLVVARAFDAFARRGLHVELHREAGWATVRDKIIYGELDAAHAPAGMLLATRLGLAGPPCEVLTAFVFNLHGNAITVAKHLADGADPEPAGLREAVRRRRGERRLTFGVVFPESSHHALLRQWLRRAQIDPDHDVRIVVVPPALMFRNLAVGTLDGYCAGEPWNSLAVHENAGRLLAWSAQLDRGHIEKVLLVRGDFAARHAGAHAALVAALHEAAAWCDEPANRIALAELLALPENLNLPFEVIAPALTGSARPGDSPSRAPEDAVVFHRGGANVPLPAHGARALRTLADAGIVPPEAAAHSDLCHELFRADLFAAATATTSVHALPH